MAMVNIERDGKQLRVPYGAFKNSFERAGWKVADAEILFRRLVNFQNSGNIRESAVSMCLRRIIDEMLTVIGGVL